MADEVPPVKLTFDASGAKQGAAEFNAAGEQVIAAENKTVAAVEQGEAKKSTARRRGAQTAKDTAAIEAAAAAAGGDAIVKATDRILVSTNKQIALLDRYAKAWDPFTAAAANAQGQLKGVLDVMAQGGEVGARAAGMVEEAVNRLNKAQANQSAGFNVAAEFQRLQAVFDPVTVSAQKMGAELADLNRAQQLGVSIIGGYAAAQDKIILKYDEGAQAAARLAAAQRELVAQARAAQAATNAQDAFNNTLGVQTSRGSIGGRSVSSSPSAALSASVFEEAFAAQEALAKETARLSSVFDTAGTRAAALQDEIDDLNAAVTLGVEITGGYDAALAAINLKYDDSAQAAKKAADAQSQLAQRMRDAQTAMVEQARAAQTAINNQERINELTGVRSSAGTIGGVAQPTGKSAAESASVFEAQFAAEKQAADELQRLTIMFDTAGTRTVALRAEIADLNAAQAAGVNITGGYRGALAAIVDKYDLAALSALKAADAQTQLAQRMRDAQTAMVEQARAAQVAVNNQERINQLAGVQTSAGTIGGVAQPTGKSAAESAAVFQEQFDNEKKLIDEREKLSAQFNPLRAQSDLYAKALQDIDRAVELNIISEKQASVARDNAGISLLGINNKLKDHKTTTGQADFATRQLGVQTIQFFSSIQAGQSILTSFIQQGHQVIDVAVATGTGFGALGKQIGSLFGSIGSWISRNPLTFGLGLIATAFTGIAIAAEASSRRLIDLTQHLRAVKGDYESLARSIDSSAKVSSATTVLSTSAARTVQQTLVSAPYAPTDEASRLRLTKLAADLGRVFNEDVPAAARRLADALQDPAKAAKELADHQFPGMTGAIARNVEILQKQGRIVEAQKIVLDTYTRQVNDASEAGTELQKALNELGKQFDSLTTNIGSFFNELFGWVGKLREWGKSFGIIPPDNFNYNARPPTKTGQELVDTQTAALQQAFPSLFAAGKSVLTDQTPGVPSNAIGHGVMQVTPETAAARGLPPGFIDANAGQNIIAGLSLLNDLSKDINGNFRNARDIMRVYGGYKTESKLDARMDRMARTSTDSLPTDIQGGIKLIGGRYGWPEWMVQLALKTAVLESGGNQFKETVGNAVKNTRNDVRQGAEEYGPGANDAILQGRSNEAQKQFENTIPGQRESLKATIDGLKDLRTRLGENSDAGKQITSVLGPLEGQLVNLRTATEQYEKSLRDQTRVSGVEEGAARKLADAYRQLDEESIRDTGHTASAAQKEAARTEILKGLGKEMQLATENAARQISNNLALAAAVDEGNGALERHQAFVKADNDAIAYGERGTQAFLKARKELTQINIDVARSEEMIASAQAAKGDRDNLRLIRAEASAMGMDSEQRALLLAHLRAELELRRQFPLLADEEIAKRLQVTDAIAKESQDLARYKTAMNDLTGMFTSAFDTIGNAMTEAFVKGEGAAVNWGTVMQGVAQQVIQGFMKMAILNPLLNSLFPSSEHRSTLEDLFKSPGANDNGSPLASAANMLGGAAGGLPIDPITRAMRVVSVGGPLGGLPPGIQGPLAGLAEGSPATGSSLGSGGSWTGASGGPAGGAGGSGGGSSDSGGGFLSSIVGKVAKVLDPSFAVRQIFGDKFYKSGGILGPEGLGLFGSSGFGPAGSMPTGMSATGGMSLGADGAMYQSGGIFHEGGLVGANANQPMRFLPAPMVINAPRFHSGLASDEFAAILQKGERVLTAGQNRRVEGVMQGAGGGGGHTINVTVPGAMGTDDARRTGYQVGNAVASRLTRATNRGG